MGLSSPGTTSFGRKRHGQNSPPQDKLCRGKRCHQHLVSPSGFYPVVISTIDVTRYGHEKEVAFSIGNSFPRGIKHLHTHGAMLGQNHQHNHILVAQFLSKDKGIGFIATKNNRIRVTKGADSPHAFLLCGHSKRIGFREGVQQEIHEVRDPRKTPGDDNLP